MQPTLCVFSWGAKQGCIYAQEKRFLSPLSMKHLDELIVMFSFIAILKLSKFLKLNLWFSLYCIKIPLSCSKLSYRNRVRLIDFLKDGLNPFMPLTTYKMPVVASGEHAVVDQLLLQESWLNCLQFDRLEGKIMLDLIIKLQSISSID